MSAAEPFPELVRWGLLGPFALYVLAWLLAVMSGGRSDAAGPWLVTTSVAVLVGLIAVSTAFFLLMRHASRYGSVGNVLLTAGAALPILPALFFVSVFSGKPGSFHI